MLTEAGVSLDCFVVTEGYRQSLPPSVRIGDYESLHIYISL